MPVHDTPTRCFYKTKVHVQGIRRRTCDSGFSTQTQNGSLGLDDFRTAGSIWFEKKTDRSTCCMHHIHLPELDDTTSFNINHKSCEIGFRAGNWLVAFHLNGVFFTWNDRWNEGHYLREIVANTIPFLRQICDKLMGTSKQKHMQKHAS